MIKRMQKKSEKRNPIKISKCSTLRAKSSNSIKMKELLLRVTTIGMMKIGATIWKAGKMKETLVMTGTEGGSKRKKIGSTLKSLHILKMIMDPNRARLCMDSQDSKESSWELLTLMTNILKQDIQHIIEVIQMSTTPRNLHIPTAITILISLLTSNLPVLKLSIKI